MNYFSYLNYTNKAKLLILTNKYFFKLKKHVKNFIKLFVSFFNIFYEILPIFLYSVLFSTDLLKYMIKTLNSNIKNLFYMHIKNKQRPKKQGQDLSIVIVGIVNKSTKKVLKAVRKHLPNAEIILSTWEGSDVRDLAGLYDKLILNKDPNAIIFDDKENKYNNLNRILISSQNGINIATRKYVLRLRSDLVLKNNNVLKLIDNFVIRNPEKSLFKERIFAYEIFSIKYDIKNRNKQRMLFHISDWCYLGLKEDLQELFSIPLVHEPDFSRYFETHNKTIDDIHSTRLWKMSPEQYITSVNAKKVFNNLKFDNYLDITDENIKISENFIINNFRVFTPKEWGISILKEEYKTVKMHIHSPFRYYSRSEQLKDYKKYCDNTIETTEMQFLQKLYDIKYFEALRKHFISFIYCKPIKKISEFISTMAYLFKFLFSLIKELIWKQK